MSDIEAQMMLCNAEILCCHAQLVSGIYDHDMESKCRMATQMEGYVCQLRGLVEENARRPR